MPVTEESMLVRKMGLVICEVVQAAVKDFQDALAEGDTFDAVAAGRRLEVELSNTAKGIGSVLATILAQEAMSDDYDPSEEDAMVDKINAAQERLIEKNKERAEKSFEKVLDIAAPLLSKFHP